MNKLIALIDCDSFFVSCEQVADPSLKGLPVVVTTGERGCIVSRSKEAKALGVKMGAPVFMDRKEHSGIIYIRARHSFYSAVSKRVMETVKKFSPVVEVSSIDEAAWPAEVHPTRECDTGGHLGRPYTPASGSVVAGRAALFCYSASRKRALSFARLFSVTPISRR